MGAGIVDLTGKTVLVTGGAKRIGRAAALALADAGAHLVLHYHASRDACEAVAGEARLRGVQAWVVQADFSAPDAVSELFEEARALAGPLDFLVNSASIFEESTLSACSAAEVEGHVRVNALTPLMLARKLAAQDRDGAVVNFLDTMIQDYDRKHVPYHLSKRMLFSLTRMMAVEFAPKVRVNAVAPGLILPPEGKNDAYVEALHGSNPLNTHGTLATVTETVLFLLRNAFLTGQVIYVDGGRRLRGSMYG